MSTAALAKTGIEAVIAGLGDFEDGMNLMNKLVGGFGRTAKDSERKFKPFQGILNAVTESLRRIGEFVIAGIILRGIEKITSAIRDMIASVIEAAVEFQSLQIRLEGLLAQEIFQAGEVETFTEALDLAVPKAEELFFWIQKLALQTPFDIKDVADVITLAEAYGFQTEKAKELTSTIIDFASGMGLSDVQMRRVIENFGQMIQQGKVAGTELRDLARGAFVPVNDVLERMRQNLGLSTEELAKMRKEGLTEVMPFIEAFTQIVGERFPDAGKRASRTIGAVVGNIKDLIQGVVSFNIVKPILDVVADRFATILDALTTGERGDKLLNITRDIGAALAEIAELFFGFLPSEENIADFIIDSLEKVKEFILGVKAILGAEGGAGEKASAILILLGVSETTLAKINDFVDRAKEIFGDLKAIFTGEEIEEDTPIGRFFASIQRSIDNFRLFWEENKEGILGAFASILESATGAGEITGETILEIIGNSLESISEKLVENGPSIVETLDKIALFISDVFLPTWEDVSTWFEENGPTILGIIAGIGAVLKLIAPVVGLFVFFLLPGFINGLITFKEKADIAWEAIQRLDIIIREKLKEAIINAGIKLDEFAEKVRTKFLELKEKAREWLENIAGNALEGFKDGFISGLINAWNNISPHLSWFVDQVRALFQESSPSRLFAKIGENLNRGLAKGIIDSIQLPAAAMDATVQHVVSAGATSMMGSNTTNNTVNNNFNMTVNSSARTEPIVQDFNTMQAIVGAT